MVGLYDLFRRSVDRFAPNAAVLWRSESRTLSLSYEEVLKECVDVARAIDDTGVDCEFVGVLMSAELCLPSAVLGILKGGQAFVFLGPDNLQVDSACILHLLDIKLVVTNVNSADRDRNVSFLSGVSGRKRRQIPTKDDVVEIWEVSGAGNAAVVSRNLAYAIQTSGTVGKPKMVKVPHKAIVPNILDLGLDLQVGPEDIMALRTPLTFDPSIVELFLPLSCGACILLAPQRLCNNPSFLLSSSVTLLQTTPSLLLQWPPALCSNGSSLRAILLGGEPFPPLKALGQWMSPDSRVRLYNLYGITELSCWATLHPIGRSDHVVPLGRPLSGTVVEVRSPGGGTVSSGEGEVFIGSSQRVCYVDDETESDLGGTVFRATGDIVKVEGDAWYYVGRTDRTVKRWGQRVHLGRLEEEAICLSSLKACAATFHPNGRLVLAVVWNGAPSRDFVVYRHLSERLPTSYLPDSIIHLEEIPLTSRGKIDYHSLGKCVAAGDGAVDECGVELLTELWHRYFGQRPSPGDNFIEAGGSSLLAVQLATELANRVSSGGQLPVAETVLLLLSKGNTFGDLVSLVTNPRAQGEVAVIPAKRKGIGSVAQKLRVKVISGCSRECPVLGQSLELSCRQGSITSKSDRKLSSNVEYGDSSTSVLKLSWRFDLKKCVDASPLLAVFQSCEPLVLVGSHSGLLAVIHGESGQVHLLVQLPDRVESGACVSACGRYAVVGCYDGYIYCFDIHTGVLLWSFLTGGMVKSSPVLSSSGDAAIAGSYDRSLYCISLQTGTCLWSTGPGEGSICTKACVTGGPPRSLVLVGSLDGACSCVFEDDGSPAWNRKLASPVFSSPVLVQSGTAVLFTEVLGVIHCFAAVSGVEVWTFTAGGNVFSTPCVWPSPGDFDLVTFGCHDKKVYCLSCPRKGEDEPRLVWSSSTDSAIFSTPFAFHDVAAGGGECRPLVVVATTAGVVCVLNLLTGSRLYSHQCPGEVFSSPVFYNGSIFVGCRDNNVYCLKVSTD